MIHTGNEILGVGKKVADNRIAYFLNFEKISHVESGRYNHMSLVFNWFFKI